MLRYLMGRMSPAGPRARLSILIFHRVLRETDPLSPDVPDARRFDMVLRWLGSWFNVLPLDRATRLLADGTLPARAAAITFDDGYADNRHVALPVLQRNGMSATFFIATGFIDGGRMWNDTIIEAIRGCRRPSLDLRDMALGAHDLGTVEQRRSAIDRLIGELKYLAPDERSQRCDAVAAAAGATLPRDLMMSGAEIVALRKAGMQIGAHSVTHPILASISDADARREIAESRRALETILDEHVGLFAYPNGKPGIDYRPAHAQMVRELGFDAAVSTAPGAAATRDDPMELPRFTPWDRSRARFGARLVANLYRARATAISGGPR
jgi:peptidoglycan/xylan/chitin deacetylase (PgdA/CDA1 family)